MSLIPKLVKKRYMNLCESVVRLVYKVSFRTYRTVTEKSCLRKQDKNYIYLNERTFVTNLFTHNDRMMESKDNLMFYGSHKYH